MPCTHGLALCCLPACLPPSPAVPSLHLCRKLHTVSCRPLLKSPHTTTAASPGLSPCDSWCASSRWGVGVRGCGWTGVRCGRAGRQAGGLGHENWYVGACWVRGHNYKLDGLTAPPL